MNLFAIDEEASAEILKIFELGNNQANKGTDNFVARNFTSKRILKSYRDHFYGLNPDVDVKEMTKSDSKSKYVHGRCWRRTIPLTLVTHQFEMEIEYGTETKDENETEGKDEVPVWHSGLPDAIDFKIEDEFPVAKKSKTQE